jgi:hypothetical protein
MITARSRASPHRSRSAGGAGSPETPSNLGTGLESYGFWTVAVVVHVCPTDVSLVPRQGLDVGIND